MKKISLKTILSILAVSSILTSCAVGPDFKKPQFTIPQEYLETTRQDSATQQINLAQWWQGLNDPIFDQLVTRSLKANKDIQIALANLRTARATAGSARTEWLPDGSVSTGHTFNYQSLTGPEAEAAGVGSTIPKGGYDRNSDFFDTAFDASWEADIFGRVRRSVEAAEAEVQVRIEDIRAVRVSLLAELATTYVQLREQQVRLNLNKRLLQSQKATLKLTKSLYEQGAGNRLDVERGEALVNSTEATLPSLRAQEAQLAATISVLTVQPLSDIRELIGQQTSLPTIPLDARHSGVPADLIRRRPDLRRAEHQLHADIARIGMVEAGLYPRFTLSGNLGWSATEFGDYHASDSLMGSFGPRVSWAFLDIPQVKQQIKSADAQADASLARYEKSIYEAIAEVETAFSSWREEQQRSQSLEQAVTHYRTALDLSKQQYKLGLQSYMDLLDAERQLLIAENTLATSKTTLTIQAVAVYKALGGGWQPEPDQQHVAMAANKKQETKHGTKKQ